jgi:Skp family chaperone for outer membrane proteins
MKIERTTPFLDHLRVRLQAAPAGRIRDHFSKTERGSMKFRMHATAAALLAASAVVSYAQAGDAAPAAKKHVHRAQTRPSAQEQLNEQIRQQIDALRQEMQSQIDSLKNDLAAKDAELKQAQQQAADAQAAAARAQQAAEQQQQADTENAAAVSTLQSTVSDLKTNQASLATTISDSTATLKKEVESPDAIRYKGVTLSPAGSFLAAETVWRSGATGGDINTAFTGIPLQNSQAAQLSEFQASGRQSRIALRGTGVAGNVTLTGYYEADFLSAGTTSNSNQSNSYTLRQRQVWGQAALNSGWVFSGGQGWSLATETTTGLLRGTEILPATIDSQYEAGFVWTRQESFRVSKDFANRFFLGASAENAETLNPAGQNLPSNYLFGSTGTGGGLYNPTANYSFNYTPDFIVKAALEPGWGHWELFAIERNFRARIYPTAGSSAGAYNDKEIGAGIGGGFRGPLFDKKVTVGLKGLWGQGVGRYGSSTIADVTVRPNGQLSPLHGFSALSTVELNPTARLNVYFNYGGDYIDRDYVLSGATQVGYGTRSVNMSGCLVEPGSPSAGATGSAPIAPANCSANNKDVQEFTAGYWFNLINGPHGRLRQGIQYSNMRRDLWSGAGGTTNPGNGAHGDDNMVFTSFRYYLP